MRLLVTRPQHQAATTIAALEEEGHEIIACPMLHRHFLDLPQPTGTFDVTVLTSRNAVDGMMRQWPQAGRDDLPVFAVGDATTEAAVAAGFLRSVSCRGSATDLVEEVSAACADGLILEGLGKPNILYPCALQPAHDLPTLFEEQELSCAAWPVYAMEDATEFSSEARRALVEETLNGVLLYSARSAEAFARLFSRLNEKPAIPPLFAFSEAICTAMPPYLAQHCRFAWEPNEAAFRLLLSQYKS